MADLEHRTITGDPESAGESFGQFAFSEKSIRMAFIRKVYAILMTQLALTFGAICFFTFYEPVKRYARENLWFVWVPFGFLIVLIIVLVCVTEARRRFPLNIILLTIFTLFESWALGAICAYYDTDAVIMAVGITAVVTLALTIFAFQTKFDFTMCSGCLFIALIVLICMGLLFAIFGSHRWMGIVYGSLGALIFSLYLVYDTQLLLGGKHRYSVSPEEYIFAALNLYLDIINLFLMLLVVIQCAKG